MNKSQKYMVFMLSLIQAMRTSAASTPTDELGGLTAQVQIFRTVATKIDENDINSGYVCAALMVDRANQYSYPYLIMGENPDIVTAKVNNLFSTVVAPSGLSFSPYIKTLLGVNFQNQVSASCMELVRTTFVSLYGDNVDCDRMLASIVKESLFNAIAIMNKNNVNPMTLFQLIGTDGDCTVKNGQFVYDYGIIVNVLGFNPSNGQLEMELGVSHMLQRSAKSDYIYG